MRTNTDDPFDYDHTLSSPHANQIRHALEGRRIENDDAPDELAIFPAAPTDADGVTDAWMVAYGESFVDLAEKR